MFFKKHNIQKFILLSLIINISLCERLPKQFLESWGEKIINEKTPDYSNIVEIVEKYYVTEEGYSLDETEIIPFGFFKQTVNGINYRLLCAIKKKADQTPTIYDIMLHKHNNVFKVLSAKSLEYSSTDMSKKDKKKMETSIVKYYFEKLYTVKEMEIQYEYHKLGGLYDYAIYDLIVKLNNEDDENVEKRLLIVYRNDRTFTVELELKETK